MSALRCVFILRCVQETETYREMVGYLRSVLYFRKISEAQTLIWIWMVIQEAQLLPALSSQSSNKWNVQMNTQSSTHVDLNVKCFVISQTCIVI